MIVLDTRTPSLSDFASLMRRTDNFLNADAARRPAYYASRAGNPIEGDVKDALTECAKGTPFQNKIIIVSGQKFPDIVAAQVYGVEVKSTKEDHWTSTGSSILESTRVAGVERIYMTFGKLGGQPRFLSKPYEQCLYGIAVTHMPRYLIDMKLDENETIFAKMHIPYDDLRQMDNPIKPVANYYRKLLKPGETLWWTGDNTDETVSATIRTWGDNVSAVEKRRYKVYALINFPEVFQGAYDNYALWLTSQGIVDSHIRDQFSAGGRYQYQYTDGRVENLPGVFRRVIDNGELLFRRIAQPNPRNFEESDLLVSAEEVKDRYWRWMNKVASIAEPNQYTSLAVLSDFYNKIGTYYLNR